MTYGRQEKERIGEVIALYEEAQAYKKGEQQKQETVYKKRGRKKGQKLHPLRKPTVRQAIFMIMAGYKPEAMPKNLQKALFIAQQNGILFKEDEAGKMWISFQSSEALCTFLGKNNWIRL